MPPSPHGDPAVAALQLRWSSVTVAIVPRVIAATAALIALLLGAACGSDGADSDQIQRFPDVVGATATYDGSTWTIAATLSSPYDTPERYADSWRVLGPDGSVYGERFLTHDHANEQPFTRSQSGIEIPDEVTVVVIEGRDQQYGWGGETFELPLER